MQSLRIGLCNALLAACTTDSDGADGGSSHAGSGGAHDAALHADAATDAGSATQDAATRKDAAASDASSEDDAGSIHADGGLCDLSIEVGPCDAAISRYAWDPSVGACVQFSFGGCQGNANNFETARACLAACAPAPVDAGTFGLAACKVGERVYPSGASGIKDPHSCNECQCDRGQLVCTEIGCPEDCPPNSKSSTSCASCGPVDNCEIVEHGCFVVCDDESECTDGALGFCIGDVCRNVCG